MTDNVKPRVTALLTAWLLPLQMLKGSRSKSPDPKAKSKLQKQGLDTVVQVCPPEEGAQVILFRKVCRAAGAHFQAHMLASRQGQNCSCLLLS